MQSTKMAFFVPLSFINPYCSVEISGCNLFLILSMISRSITFVKWLIIDVVWNFSQLLTPGFFGIVIKVDL